MIKPIEILQLLFVQQGETSIIETVTLFELRGLCQKPNSEIKERLEEIIEGLILKDPLQIAIELDGGSITFDSSQKNNDSFFSGWSEFVGRYSAEKQINVTLTITKLQHGNDTINVYDAKQFWEYLNRLSLQEFILKFSTLFSKGEEQFFFILSEGEKEFSTSTVHFINSPDNKQALLHNKIPHRDTWAILNSIVHFAGIPNCLALPDDFKLISKEHSPPTIITKFEQACLVLSIASFYDYSFLEKETFSIKLKGYKTFSRSIPITALSLDNAERYFQIYQWITEGNRINDKVGIARNLLSLNIDATDGYSINDSAISSVLSGYKVYEQQNVKQYIELRNKMSDQLVGFNERANKIVEGFAGGFHKSALAVGSLFATFIVTRVLSAQNFVDVFTLDATIIAFVFLMISLIYFFISKWEIREQKQRFKDSYENMKERNKDLLNEEDISRILNNDAEYIKDVNFMDAKEAKYSALWIGSIILFFVSIISLFTIYCIHNPKN